jgi:energy-coupling factor transport system ATP-binding protein
MGLNSVRTIRLESVSSQYRRSKTSQLNDISLEIKEGELTLLMGPSGSGKSTLVLLLNGIIPHHTKAKVTGTIDIFGQDPLNTSVLNMANHIGMLLQDPESQLATSRVKDEIIFTLEFQGLPREEIDRKLDQLLKEFGLDKFAEADSTRMSGGEKQLIAFAAMMARDPEIIILDEPTSNLDPVNTDRILNFVKKYKNKGKTVILIEHKLDEVFNICSPDKILLMNNGKINAHETPHNLFKTTTIDETGLSLPTIARLVENSGLISRKDSILPVSIENFKKFANDLTETEINALSKALQTPKRLELKSEKNLLRFTDVSFGYKNQPDLSLKNISFDINEGEFVAIIGNNGAGKSTLVKQIIGLNKPTKGNVIVDSTDTRKTTAAQLAHKVSFLFQNPDNQLFAGKVIDEVKYAPIKCKVPKEEALLRSQNAINAVNLEEYTNNNPLKLSMGQKQRVAVASVLAMRPKLILLDEPTTGQDPTSLEGIMNLMKKEYQENTNIIMITHDMNLVDRVANRVLVLSNNKILADGNTDVIFSNANILEKSNLKAPLRVQMLSILKEMKTN